MKQLKFLLLTFLCGIFASCGKYSDGTSVWSKGAWIVPALLIAGALGFAVYGFKRMNSGTVIGGSTSDPTIRDVSGRVRWYKITQLIWAVILMVIAIAVIIYQNSQK